MLTHRSVHDRMQLLAFMEAGVSGSRNRHGIWFLSVESNSVVRLEHNRAHRRHAVEVNDVEKATGLRGSRNRVLRTKATRPAASILTEKGCTSRLPSRGVTRHSIVSFWRVPPDTDTHVHNSVFRALRNELPLTPAADLLVLSLGCTTSPLNIYWGRKHSLGKFQWAEKIADVFLSGQSSGALGMAQHLVPDRETIVRVSPAGGPRYGLDKSR